MTIGDDIYKVTVTQGTQVTFNWDDANVFSVWLFSNKKAFKTCDFSNAKALATESPYSFRANAVRNFYFGCAVSSHCWLGQKMQLIVTRAYMHYACVEFTATT